jgi:hypothetical protein
MRFAEQWRELLEGQGKVDVVVVEQKAGRNRPAGQSQRDSEHTDEKET